MSASAGFQIHGYVECNCGALLPDTDLRPAPPMCPDCRSDLTEAAKAARLTYEVQGRTFRTPLKKPPKTKRRVKSLTDEQKDARRRIDRARMRTYVRLAQVYRPMYEMLLNEEKLREGLHPDTQAITPRPRAVAAALEEDIAAAHERAGRERQASAT